MAQAPISHPVFADMIGALASGEVDAVVDDEPAFGNWFTDPCYKLALTVNTANLWGAVMQTHQIELKQALDSALNNAIKLGLVSHIWQHHLADIAYPESCFTN